MSDFKKQEQSLFVDRVVFLRNRDKFGIRSFNFSHDAFVTNKRLVEQVCDRILEAGLDITWRCSARVDCLTEENFDKLVFDPSIKILSRDIFGYEEELEIIKENKAIFPFYYHLDTPVRKEYQYMHYFVDLYWRYPIAMKPLRKLYQGDNLQFYKDFVAANASCFAGNMDTLAAYLQEQPLQVFYNMADYLNVPYVRQLKALLKYSYDVTRLYQSPEDVTIHDTYEFNYVDMNMQRPVSQFTPGKTEILLEKKAGVPNIQVLNIQWGE